LKHNFVFIHFCILLSQNRQLFGEHVF
jgi:hypothetical protein